MNPWLALYDRTGTLIARVPGKVCLACGDIVLVHGLDSDGRCATCGPLMTACTECECDWPSEDVGSGMCPGCHDREDSGVWAIGDEAQSGGV